MIDEILFTSKFDSDKRLREIVARQKARLQTGLGESGHVTAITRAGSYYAPSSYFNERTNGIEYFRLIEKLDENFDEMKEELKHRDFSNSIPMGFLTYPVSQTADITAFNATIVPVGEDQLPMIEQAREIVRSFNNLYGETLVEPKAVLHLSNTQSKLPYLFSFFIVLTSSRFTLE